MLYHQLNYVDNNAPSHQAIPVEIEMSHLGYFFSKPNFNLCLHELSGTLLALPIAGNI